jgi:uncharacterized protein HemY
VIHSEVVHSVTVSPLIVVVHAPETEVKDESEESRVMIEPSERVEDLSVTVIVLPSVVVVVVVHSVTFEPSIQEVQVEVGVV